VKEMGIQSSAEITRALKEKWDKSKNKDDWRVLTGRNHKGRYDMFVSTPNRILQLKFEQTGGNEAVGYGQDVGKMDEEIERIMSTGAPVPFGLISPQQAELAIIMAGIQRYSSDAAHMLRKDYISNAQAKLDEKLDGEIERMRAADPVFRRKYREQKERERIPYL
jgi:hypothetical protein